jgi:hypothetical protein
MAIFLGGKDIDTIPDYINNGRYRFEYFANKIDCAGDINGDGYKDIIVGSLEGPNCNKSGSALLLSLNKTLDVTEKKETELKDYKLFHNYPNPFNPATTISYDLPEQSSVEVKIYDIMGNEVRTFLFNSQTSGYHNLKWDGRNSNNQPVSSGTYIYKLRAVSAEGRKIFERSSKMLLLK